MGEGLDKTCHSFAQTLSLNSLGHSKISDQILYWSTYLKGLKDPPDWARVFRSDFSEHCILLDMRLQWTTARQWMLFWWWSTVEPWDKRDQEGLLLNENFHLGTEQYFEQFLPHFFPITGQSSKISSDPYNCLVLLVLYFVSEEELV